MMIMMLPSRESSHFCRLISFVLLRFAFGFFMSARAFSSMHNESLKGRVGMRFAGECWAFYDCASGVNKTSIKRLNLDLSEASVFSPTLQSNINKFHDLIQEEKLTFSASLSLRANQFSCVHITFRQCNIFLSSFSCIARFNRTKST